MRKSEDWEGFKIGKIKGNKERKGNKKKNREKKNGRREREGDGGGGKEWKRN